MTDDILREAYLFVYSDDPLPAGLDSLRRDIADAIADVGIILACETTDRGWQLTIEYEGEAIGRFVLIEVMKCLRRHGCTGRTTLDNGRHRRDLLEWAAHLQLGRG